MKLASFIGAIAFAASASLATAGTITFDSLSGPNGTTFTSVTEDGVSASSNGGWQHAFNVGNAVPSIFSFANGSSIDVTHGGLFNFASFDGGSGGSGGATFGVEGFLGGASVFAFSAMGGSFAAGFATILNPFSASDVDLVRITADLTGTTSANIDNITATPAAVVPLPAPAFLLLAALGGMAATRRRRKAA